MPGAQNKNVRMGETALEVLRALKYDLDESDGAIMEQALRARALERLHEHVGEAARLGRGLPGEGRREEHLTAAQVLVTALNRDGERYRLEGGRLRVRPGGEGDWLDGWRVHNLPIPLVRACISAAEDEARDSGCTYADMASAALSITRPGTPGRRVLEALGVDADGLRASLLPLATRGTETVDRSVGLSERAFSALMVEPGAEVLRLAHWSQAWMRVQPEHVVLSVARKVSHKLLAAFESQAATYDLLRLRLTAETPIAPFSPALVGAFARAFEIARQAAWWQLSPHFLVLALAEAGPDTTPGADPDALRASLQGCDRCRPKEHPLAPDQPVELAWTVRRAFDLIAAGTGGEPLTPAAFFLGLARAIFTASVPSAVQEARGALEAAGMRGEEPARA